MVVDFPPEQLIKQDLEYIKQNSKYFNIDTKTLAISINEVLSIGYKDKFIFNRKNLRDICKIFAYSLSFHKKNKITNYSELKENINKIDFQKIKFRKVYQKTEKNHDFINLSMSKYYNICKTSAFYNNFKEQIQKLYHNDVKTQGKNIKLNVSQIESKRKFYIDTNFQNIIPSSILTKYYDYNEEEVIKNMLTGEDFNYPKCKEKDIVKKTNLPIELVLLLSKLRNVRTLIFQILDVDEEFKILAIFLLMNIKILFCNGIEEVTFDLGNEDIQKNLNEIFIERTLELYEDNRDFRNLTYNNGSFQARTINCWEPEEDIFFHINKKNTDNNIIYNCQPNDVSSTFDNYLCNIYDEYGRISNYKYIYPVYLKKKKYYNQINMEEKFNELEINNRTFESLTNDESFKIYDYNKFDINKVEEDLSLRKVLSTPIMVTNVISKYKNYFEMILIYCHFLSQNLKKITSLSLYFHTSYSYEFSLLYNLRLNLDQAHFLILLKQLESLEELNISFNSLDDKSFEYFIGIINKNSSLNTLRISFFSPNINYFDGSLFNIISGKKISLTQLFKEYKQYELNNKKEKELKIYYFILNKILLDVFELNLTNFFNLFKIKLVNQLKELVFRLDIPNPLLDNSKYTNLICKFVLNIFTLITFQYNKIKTFKLLAPFLEFNSNKMPYLRQFFKEISLSSDIEEDEEIEFNNVNIQEKDIVILENHNDFMQGIEIFNEQNLSINQDDRSTNSDSSNMKINGKNFIKRSELNRNLSLQNIVLKLKIYNIPEIFNICLMNNLNGLKTINLGILDMNSFVGFINDYKRYYTQLISLKCLKITLAKTVISYDNFENDLFDYININPEKLKEKYLFSILNLNAEQMNKLYKLIYFTNGLPNMVIQIGSENSQLFSKIRAEYLDKNKKEIMPLILSLNYSKYKNIANKDIISSILNFSLQKENSAIICKDFLN